MVQQMSFQEHFTKMLHLTADRGHTDNLLDRLYACLFESWGDLAFCRAFWEM